MTYSTFYESKYWAATLILRRLEVEDSRHSITSTLASYVPALWSILGDKEASYQGRDEEITDDIGNITSMNPTDFS